MLILATFDQNSVIVRVKILDSTVTTGAGKTGLTNASSGLIISTIADSEATATTYTAAASNVETITTLGTYAAPTSGKCRFKEVDATNHPGVYELQFADARFAVASAKSILISVHGATNAAQCDAVIPLMAPNSDLANEVRDAILSDSTPFAGATIATIPTSIAALNNISAADVNAEMVDVMTTDTHAEPGQGAPPATTSYGLKIDYLFKWTRNKKDNDGSTTQFFSDNGTTVDHKQTTSSAGGTVTKGEIVSGP